MSLSEQVAIHGRFRSDDIAFVHGDVCVTWRDFDARANQFAHYLIRRGVKPGDRVAMVFGSEISAYVAMFGIWRAGAAFAPLSSMLSPETVAQMIRDAGAKIVVFSAPYLDLATASASDGVEAICFEDAQDDIAALTASAPGVAIKPDGLANIIYSSGTTGAPKGIPHTHRARHALIHQLGIPFTPRSRGFLAIPPYSNAPILIWGPCVYNGATTILMDQFDVPKFFDLVGRWRPTHGFLVPTMCQAILAHPAAATAGLDCFQYAITAGAPMPVPMKEKMIELTENGFAELWGLTEGVGTFIFPFETPERLQSVGRPMAGVDIRLINENGDDVTFKSEGEIVGRSASLMNGYWGRPDLNAEIMWRGPDGCDYLKTGDIGEFDKDGYLTIRGRVKDMLISGGVNVYPADIEAELLRHAAVRDAAVVGVPHEKWGETPVAFIIPADGKAADEPSAIRGWANERLARHQRVSDLVCWEGDFPRNTLGKVLKQDLKDHYTNGVQ